MGSETQKKILSHREVLRSGETRNRDARKGLKKGGTKKRTPVVLGGKEKEKKKMKKNVDFAYKKKLTNASREAFSTKNLGEKNRSAPVLAGGTRGGKKAGLSIEYKGTDLRTSG